MTPMRIDQSGLCVYTEEQLAKFRKTIPDMKEDALVSRAGIDSARAEVLMLKGVHSPTLIAQILECSRGQADHLIRSVHARWEVLGGPRSTMRSKGEAASKLTMLENEYWTLFAQGEVTPQIKTTILSNLVTLIDRKLLLHGLSPKVLEDIAQESVDNVLQAETPMHLSVEMKNSLAEATREAVKLVALAQGIQQQEQQAENDSNLIDSPAI
jgi:hypothetical protein